MENIQVPTYFTYSIYTIGIYYTFCMIPCMASMMSLPSPVSNTFISTHLNFILIVILLSKSFSIINNTRFRRQSIPTSPVKYDVHA